MRFRLFSLEKRRKCGPILRRRAALNRRGSKGRDFSPSCLSGIFEVANTAEAREDRASVPGTRDRGATSQYLKTADSIAAKHLIGPAQSDLGGFFVANRTRSAKKADGIAAGYPARARVE